MKKIVKVLLVGLLTLTLTACQSEQLDAASIYQTARDNMQALDSFTTEVSMVMSMSSGSEDSGNIQISIPINMTYVLVEADSESPEMYMLMSVNMLGMSSSYEQWYIDGISYIDEDGDRYIETSEDVEILSYDLLSIDEMKSVSATRNSDGYDLEIVVDGLSLMNLIMGELGDSSASSLFSDIEIADSVTLTVQVSADYYITAASIAMSFDVADVESFDLTADYSYYDFNSSSLPDIDTSNFTDGSTTDSDYSYTDFIYGDYDLTTDYAEDLIALGYEDIGNYMYDNGTYIIDLEYKLIYYQGVVYDWELDEGYLYNDDYSVYNCYYDFVFDISDDDGCDVSTLQSLRDTYNELASSILEE